MKRHVVGMLMGLTLAASARAELVVIYDFTATITEIAKYYGSPETGPEYVIKGGVLAEGYTITGSIPMIVSDLPFSWSNGASQAMVEYNYFSDKTEHPFNFTVDQTAYRYAYKDLTYTSLTIMDSVAGEGPDWFNIQAQHSVRAANGYTVTYEMARFDLNRDDGELLSGRTDGGWPTLPASFDLARLDSPRLVYSYSDYHQTPGNAINNGYSVVAEFTSFRVRAASPVPEPSSWMMLGAGMLLFAGLARRRAMR